MNKLFKRAVGIIALALIPLLSNGQTPDPEFKHFEKDGLSFDYPANAKFEDRTESGGQHLVLTHAGTGAQIMVVARYDMIDTAEQLAKARKDVFDFFVDSIVKEFERQQAKVERVEKQIEVGGSQATGVRLRAVLGGEPGNAEIYSTLLGRRLVLVSIIGSDKELSAAASAWGVVRRSLRIAQTTASITSGPAETPDAGSVTGTTYANKYFGLTLTIPTGWQVQDSTVKKQISEKGKEIVTSDDPAKKGELDRAADSTLNLLTVSQFPVGEPGRFNSMFLCGAEKIPAGVKTDVDYMSALKNTLKYSQVPITVERDGYAEQIEIGRAHV